MDDLKDIADRIIALAQKEEPFFALGPIPENRIMDAERELGLKISGSFRAYLLYLGAAMMLGQDFAGLPTEEDFQSADAEFYHLNIVDVTMEYRSFMENLPHSYVYIADNGGWITFWIDTAREKDGEAPVVAFSYEKEVYVCDGFLSFVDLFTHREDLYTIFGKSA